MVVQAGDSKENFLAGKSSCLCSCAFPRNSGLKNMSPTMFLWTRNEWPSSHIASNSISEHTINSFQQTGRIHFKFHDQLKLGTPWRMHPSWFLSTRDTSVCVCVHMCLCICMLKTTRSVSRRALFHLPFAEELSLKEKDPSNVREDYNFRRSKEMR